MIVLAIEIVYIWIYSMYRHLSRPTHELSPAPDLQHSSLPVSRVYLFQDINTDTLISSHCAVQWVGAIRHTRSSFWKIKAGFPAEPSLISKRQVARRGYLCSVLMRWSLTLLRQMNIYFGWHFLNLLLSFDGPGLFILPVTFMYLHNFPVISGTNTWGWPAGHYGRRSSNTCVQWQKQPYVAWLLYSSGFQLNSSLCGTMQQNSEPWWSLECIAWGVW